MSRAANMFIWARSLAPIPLLLMGCLVQADPPVFEIGKFSLDPSKQVPQVQPMAEYLAIEMAPFGYLSGRAQVFPDFDSARQAMANGSMDIMTTSLYEAAQMIRGGQASPLVIKWKNELPEYSSLVIVNADSDIYQLEDLVGKTLAFEDDGSTSAFFIPYMAIEKAGLRLSNVADSLENSSAVHYRFTGAEQNSSALLLQKKVDAIALSDNDWLKSNHVPKEHRDNFRIVWISEPYPTAVEVINSQIPPEQKAYLRDTLVRMHLIDQGQDVLDQYHESSRFTRFSDQARAQLETFVEFLESGSFPSGR